MGGLLSFEAVKKACERAEITFAPFLLICSPPTLLLSPSLLSDRRLAKTLRRPSPPVAGRGADGERAFPGCAPVEARRVLQDLPWGAD